MKNIILVLKHELYTIVSRRSFLITLIVLPFLSFIIFYVISSFRETPAENPFEEFFAPAPEPEIEGYIDHSGVIRSLPEELEDRLVLFVNAIDADTALQEGEIDGYFTIPEDYLESGQIFYTRPDYNPLAGMMDSDVIETVLTYNLLEQDETLVSRLGSLYELDVKYLDDQPQRDPDNALTFFLPYAVTFLFYIVIFGSASLMLNSITKEKTNRVLEILLTSIRPIEMLTGKIISMAWSG